VSPTRDHPLWADAVGAMRARRRELIAKPVDQVYADLLEAALDVLYPLEPINIFKDDPEEPGATSPR
jgi:hypothetical protein